MARKPKKYVPLVNYREFLNIPGHHDGAYIMVYLEDTSKRELSAERYGYDEDENVERPFEEQYFYNFAPKTILDIADCDKNITLEIEVGGSEAKYENSLHKIDTLMEGLAKLREGVVVERALWEKRDKELKAIKKKQKAINDAKREEASEGNDEAGRGEKSSVIGLGRDFLD